ncbi:protein sex-lethal-like [Lycorma delicatula]|uniref:protein sex-lethal-like n=1 Tax=Lycorma delicatula TaxID=130591 RepID=UPI003F515CCD
MSIPSDSDQQSMTRLIINYLPQSTTEKELYGMFVTVGPVESCRVMKDHKTGYSYGFGFVNYTRPEDAALAIARLNGIEVKNKRLKVSYARPSSDDIKDTNLYITNLPKHYNEEDLENLFGKYGTIVKKNILKDKLTGMPRGVAFVRYDRRDQANEAIRALDGYTPEGSPEKLSVKIAEEHGKRKAAYFAGYQAGFNQSRGTTVVTPTGAARGRGGPARNGPAINTRQLVAYPHISLGGGRGFIGGGVVRQDKNTRNKIGYDGGFYGY